MSDTANADVSSNIENDISDIFSIISNISDKNTESKEDLLLNSLKPYLNKKRQKKLEQCQKIMSITDMIKVLYELHLFDDFLENTD